MRPELEGAEMQAGKQEAAEEEHEYLNAHMTHGRRVGAESSLRDAGDMGNNGIDGVFAEIPANGDGVEKFATNVANWFYQRGGSVQSNVKAANASGNGGRDDLPRNVLSAARPCHVLPSGESRHWWLRGASRPRGHQ